MTSPARARPTKTPDPTPPSGPPKPTLWDALLDSIPPWADEVVALMLVIFGILSFLAVLGIATDGTIPRAWAQALTALFGVGSLLVSGGILGLGVIMLLPKVGLEIAFPTRRVIALEVMFLASLALLHLTDSSGLEARALARAGGGGGLVGWALSGPFIRLFGSTTVVVLWVLAFTLSLGLVVGVRHARVKRLLGGLADLLKQAGQKLGEHPAANRERRRTERAAREAALARLTAQQALEARAAAYALPRVQLLRVRADTSKLPPSLRPTAAVPAAPAPPAPDALPGLFQRGRTGETFSAIGEILEEPSRKKVGVLRQAKRPDGRVKRYFSVDDVEEPKRIGRRRAELPPLDLLGDSPLHTPDEHEINTNVVLIENTLLEFDIDIDVVDVRIGPTVTRYAIQPYRDADNEDDKVLRTRVGKIATLADDLSLSLSARRLRIEAPVPGTNTVGIEVPNHVSSLVSLRSVYESKVFYEAQQKAKTPLLVPLGRDVAGQPFSIDLAEMPHLLIGGTTGSGKSVCIAALVTALLLNTSPADVRLVLLDPKMVELGRFNGVPHLLGPVETDHERILGVLRWVVREMERRYALLEEAGTRNIRIYNERQIEAKADTLPYIVVFIDEIGDLMMAQPDETELNITRLAQMARAVGIHLVVATQRPSVDVITGLIKANFPGRIAFAVASGVDSRVILDASGAENLLGRGDMLFLASDAAGPQRVQGCYISEDEVRAVVRHWQSWYGEQVQKGRLERYGQGPWERTLTKLEMLSETDDLLEVALKFVIEVREASATAIQRHLNIGYPRAARIMDLLHELGAIGPPEPGGKMRKVLVSATRLDPMAELIEERRKKQRAAAKAAKAAAKAEAPAPPSPAATPGAAPFSLPLMPPVPDDVAEQPTTIPDAPPPGRTEAATTPTPDAATQDAPDASMTDDAATEDATVDGVPPGAEVLVLAEDAQDADVTDVDGHDRATDDDTLAAVDAEVDDRLLVGEADIHAEDALDDDLDALHNVGTIIGDDEDDDDAVDDLTYEPLDELMYEDEDDGYLDDDPDEAYDEDDDPRDD